MVSTNTVWLSHYGADTWVIRPKRQSGLCYTRLDRIGESRHHYPIVRAMRPTLSDQQGLNPNQASKALSPESKSPPLVIRDLHKHYKNGTWANRGISLDGFSGEILCILGPNGAGKTTLVRQITTELIPTSGFVQVLGYDVQANPLMVKSLLGVVPQEATLFGYLTVKQHLRIFAKLRGMSGKDANARTEQLLSELDLNRYRDVAIDKLSGGLNRRVLVGIASTARPAVIIMDEPTTGLDPRSRRTLWSMLRGLRDAGSFVLLTTHSMEEAEALCDRVGIIKGGELVALDTVENLRAEFNFEFKLTYHRGNRISDDQILYGSDDQGLIERAREMGVNQYSVSRTTLEDIYLTITGNLAEVDESDD